LEKWRLGGLEVHAKAITGEAFWSAIEITECEALLAATQDALKGTYRAFPAS
jgi:hypothetical protein